MIYRQSLSRPAATCPFVCLAFWLEAVTETLKGDTPEEA